MGAHPIRSPRVGPQELSKPLTYHVSVDAYHASTDTYSVTLVRMETLLELINRVLATRGETVTAFATRIGVNRLTVNRWKQSLPAPDTLRRVADELDVPYSHVLRAAMASSGYATSPTDLLAGQQVHIVTRIGDDEPELTANAFVDADRATAYVQAMSAVGSDPLPAIVGYDQTVAIIDEAQIPDTINVFTTIWSSRADQIHQHSTLARSTPARLIDREVTDVEATALAETDQVFMLQADSLTAEAGRSAITSALAALRKQGRLHPPEVDPVPVLGGWARYVETLKETYSEPQTGEDTAGSPMQTVPPLFAAARRRAAEAGWGQKVVWPQTHRFVVPPEEYSSMPGS